MTRPLLRFAPSPNGRLHLGHAYSALLNDRLAREGGGSWLLRLEDIDPVRATPALAAALEEDLAWLGLSWPRPVRRQSEHGEVYAAASARLRASRLIYRCFCSRGAVADVVAADEQRTGLAAARDPDGAPLYPGTCRSLPSAESEARARAGLPYAWRLDTASAISRAGPLRWRSFDPADRWPETEHDAAPGRWGDPVLVRKDVPTSYHLAVVCDDALQGITHVVRGRDLVLATDLHALLARCLDLPSPAYHHHGLLVGPDGRKLAKSRGSESIASLREAGATPESVRHRLGFP